MKNTQKIDNISLGFYEKMLENCWHILIKAWFKCPENFSFVGFLQMKIKAHESNVSVPPCIIIFIMISILVCSRSINQGIKLHCQNSGGKSSN